MAFDHGQGVTLYDTEGRAYTDFFAGIAVNALGYNHPAVTKAIVEQAGKVCHTSNLYYIEPQAKLAKLLCENSFADKVFLGNSGAEANEGAMKLAVKYFYEKGEDRYEILTARNSFHGRTLATIAATGQEKYQKPYAKLLPACVRNVPFGDLAALRAAATPHTAAVMLEVIQAEGGVVVGEADYIQGVRALCDELGLLLIVDEVQTGMGRCGALFAHELYGIVPGHHDAGQGPGRRRAHRRGAGQGGGRRGLPPRGPRLDLRRQPPGLRGGAGGGADPAFRGPARKGQEDGRPS